MLPVQGRVNDLSKEQAIEVFNQFGDLLIGQVAINGGLINLKSFSWEGDFISVKKAREELDRIQKNIHSFFDDYSGEKIMFGRDIWI